MLICEAQSAARGNKALPRWVAGLKSVGTVAVSVTFFTVVLFLGPVFGFGGMFAGANFFLHLVSPLLAMISLCAFENREPLRFRVTFLGLLPTFIYGIVYVWLVVFQKTWPDFYGFNIGGHWAFSAVAMLIATYLISLVLWGIRKTLGKERAKIMA